MALREAPPVEIAAAVLLAYLAGCVDAVGVSLLGGVFVSFMSGNTTRLGLDLVAGGITRAVPLGIVIVSFVVGAAIGGGFATVGPRWRRAAMLTLEAAALGAATTIGAFGHPQAAAALMAAAMGLENEIFVTSRSETRISLTFVSGTLVKIGEGLGRALCGGARWDWWPFLGLWTALFAGVVSGGLCYAAIGLDTLVGVGLALLAMAAAFAVIDRAAPGEPRTRAIPPGVG